MGVFTILPRLIIIVLVKPICMNSLYTESPATDVILSNHWCDIYDTIVILLILFPLIASIFCTSYVSCLTCGYFVYKKV